MDLLNIRKKFRDISGRFDLVNDDNSDHGSDFLINEGSKWLDRRTKVQKSYASRMEIVPMTTLFVQFPYCRAVKEVWLSTDEGRWQLEKKDLQDLMAGYLGGTPAELESGTPLYYSPALTRYIPEDMSAATLATFTAYLETITLTGYEYNAILLNVPVDRDTLVDIRGLFYSIALVNDEDTNYWSSIHPLTLIMAAVRQSYMISGNSPMLKVTEENLVIEIADLGMDLVEEEIAEVNQIED